jgi:hypothetical protein
MQRVDSHITSIRAWTARTHRRLALTQRAATETVVRQLVQRLQHPT